MSVLEKVLMEEQSQKNGITLKNLALNVIHYM